MLGQINIINNLPYSDNNQIKIKIQYNKIIDDITESITYSTDFIDMIENEFIVGVNKKIGNIGNVHVYLVHDHMAYLFKFVLDNETNCLRINISMGENNPIVRVNNIKAIRRDEIYMYSPFRFCCTCGSITMGLDNIEQAENNVDNVCIIF